MLSSLRTLFIILLLTCLGPVFAAQAEPAAAGKSDGLSSQQIQKLIDTLENEKQREVLVDALRTLAAVTKDGSEDSGYRINVLFAPLPFYRFNDEPSNSRVKPR